MKTVIQNLFGTYSPVMTVTPVVDNITGNVVSVPTVAGGLAGVDWTWCAGVFLFAIVLYSVFKIVGLLFKNI